MKFLIFVILLFKHMSSYVVHDDALTVITDTDNTQLLTFHGYAPSQNVPYFCANSVPTISTCDILDLDKDGKLSVHYGIESPSIQTSTIKSISTAGISLTSGTASLTIIPTTISFTGVPLTVTNLISTTSSLGTTETDTLTTASITSPSTSSITINSPANNVVLTAGTSSFTMTPSNIDLTGITVTSIKTTTINSPTTGSISITSPANNILLTAGTSSFTMTPTNFDVSISSTSVISLTSTNVVIEPALTFNNKIVNIPAITSTSNVCYEITSSGIYVVQSNPSTITSFTGKLNIHLVNIVQGQAIKIYSTNTLIPMRIYTPSTSNIEGNSMPSTGVFPPSPNCSPSDPSFPSYPKYPFTLSSWGVNSADFLAISGSVWKMVY